MTTKLTAPTLDARVGRYRVVDPSELPDELQPLPDAMQQETHYLDAVGTIRAIFRDDPTAFVSGNTIVCYNPDNLNDRVLPDCYAAFGVDPDAIVRQNGYLTWVVGPPAFVLEIASVSTARNDLTRKWDLYAAMRVGESWQFDATAGMYYGHTLAGWRLVGDTYIRIDLEVNSDGLEYGFSAVLGLRLCIEPVEEAVEEDRCRLVLQNPVTGDYYRTHNEAEDLIAEQSAALAARDAMIADARAALAEQREAAAEARAETQREEARRTAAEAALADARATIRALEEGRLRRSQPGQTEPP